MSPNVLQSLQNKSYNHFAAIYYLLVERLKAHRCSFPVEQRLDARQRRPSTIAEQTVVKVGQGVLNSEYVDYLHSALIKALLFPPAPVSKQLHRCDPLMYSSNQVPPPAALPAASAQH